MIVGLILLLFFSNLSKEPPPQCEHCHDCRFNIIVTFSNLRKDPPPQSEHCQYSVTVHHDYRFNIIVVF